VKTPFSTNSHNKKWANSLEDIIKRIKGQYKDLYNAFPYTMVQATMKNRKEYKVVLFNREPRYISILRKSTGQAFSESPHTRLMGFAVDALNEFSSSCPDALLDSLVRVDIFQTKLGKLVVNEVESLEADHYSRGEVQKVAVDNEIRQYYESILRSVLHENHFRPIFNCDK